MRQQTVSGLIDEIEAAKLIPVVEAVRSNIENVTASRLCEGSRPYISNPKRLHLVCALLASLNANRMLEIGTGRGYCAIGAVLVGRSLRRDVYVDTIDAIPAQCAQNWGTINHEGIYSVQEQSLAEVLERYGCSKEVNVLPGTSVKWLRRLVGQNGYPIVFIDGCHSVVNVAHDLFFGCRLLVEGGWIVMDDFGGAQGAGTRRVVSFAHRFGWIDARVIDMEHGISAPDVEREHAMAVVRPSVRLVRFLRSWLGRIFLNLVRFGAWTELGINSVKSSLARAIIDR